MESVSNKLFVVCPFCCLENFIRHKYGEDVFFITGIAAILPLEDQEYAAVVRDFITRENITQIFIVNDASCQFLKGVIKKETGSRTPEEKRLQEHFLDNYSTILQNHSLFEQQKQLAYFNINHQAKELAKSKLFEKQMLRNEISIRMVITAIEQDTIIEQVIE